MLNYLFPAAPLLSIWIEFILVPCGLRPPYSTVQRERTREWFSYPFLFIGPYSVTGPGPGAEFLYPFRARS